MLREDQPWMSTFLSQRKINDYFCISYEYMCLFYSVPDSWVLDVNFYAQKTRLNFLWQ